MSNNIPKVLLITNVMFLIVLSSLVVLASAASGPKACCFSRTLSGVMLTVSGTHQHGDDKINIQDNVIEFHYDWDEKETVVVTHLVNFTAGVRQTSTIRLDYQFATTYITTGDGRCFRQDLDPNSILHPCFAANFTYRASSKIGSGSESVPINQYYGYWDGDNVGVTLTADGECMPVSWMAYGEHGQVRRTQSYVYSNLKKVVDKNLFSIPRNCMNAQKIPNTKRALDELTGVPIGGPF